jgi:tripartite-type tricarboxylate transporter receptor subunit TctC
MFPRVSVVVVIFEMTSSLYARCNVCPRRSAKAAFVSSILCAVLTVLAGIIALPSLVQPYPARHVRLIVGSSPQGGSDVLARLLAAKLSDTLGQQVVVENRAGASGIIGAEIVARSAPDGHTLLLTQASLAINPAMHSKMPYDALRDFAPICVLVGSGSILVVHPSVPVKTVPELIKLARANPGKLVIGSPGQGTQPHLAGALFNIMAKVDMPQIQYKGASAAAISLLSGEISVQFSSYATLGEHIKGGKARPLGVSTDKRLSLLPNVPTIAEAALPGFESSQWFGVLSRAGTPRPIIERLNQEINKFLAMPDVRERLIGLAYEIRGGTPEEFSTLLKLETEKWAKVVKSAGIKPE